jgi:MOSC domain-containing protein YiiM
VKRFAAAGRPGPYLRVLEEGTLQAGDALVVEYRPAHDVTVSTMFRALTTDRSLLPELLQVEGLVAEARRAVEKYVASAASAVRPGRA